jgi:hypothetical protein
MNDGAIPTIEVSVPDLVPNTRVWDSSAKYPQPTCLNHSIGRTTYRTALSSPFNCVFAIGFMQFLVALALAVALMIGSVAAFAANFGSDGQPPETPDKTAEELYACLSQNGGDREACYASLKGLTASEFIAMGMGCFRVMDGPIRRHCITGVDKLRRIL